MFRSSTKHVVILLALSLLPVLAFQNCSPSRFSNIDEPTFAKSSGEVIADNDVVVEEEGETPVKDEPVHEENCTEISTKDMWTSDENALVYAACPGESGKQCVVVCHVPAGNPANAKTHLLPLAALNGHSAGSHGGDYYGPCDAEQETVKVCE